MMGRHEEHVWMRIEIEVSSVIQEDGSAIMRVPVSALDETGRPSLDWVRVNFPDDEVHQGDKDDHGPDAYHFTSHPSLPPQFDVGQRVKVARDGSRYTGDLGYVQSISLDSKRRYQIVLDRKKQCGGLLRVRCHATELRTVRT